MTIPREMMRMRFSQALSLTLSIIVLAGLSFGQLRGTLEVKDSSSKGSIEHFAPEPVIFSAVGNITCASVRDSGLAQFDHMTEDWEFKVDPPSVGNNGPFTLNPMTVGPGNPNMTLSFNLSSSTTMTQWSLGWTSVAAIDRLVSAIIVKGGNIGTNVYPYDPLSSGDTGSFTVTGGTNAISHISFCFEPFTAPTAADGTISGRTMKMDGTGISNARIEVLNLSTGEIRQAISNPFGYYKLEGIETNDLYMVTVSHRRYQFANPQRTISFDGDLVDVDFVAF